MKKILVLFCLISSFAFAGVLDDSYRIFNKNPDELFLSSISALNSSKAFEISEIQTKNGYILFKYENRYYLLTLTKKYLNQTEVKVLPQNSDFSDNGETAKMVFSLIDYQLKYSPMELIK